MQQNGENTASNENSVIKMFKCIKRWMTGNIWFKSSCDEPEVIKVWKCKIKVKWDSEYVDIVLLYPKDNYSSVAGYLFNLSYIGYFTLNWTLRIEANKFR